MANGQKGTIEFQRINTKDLVPHPIAQRDFMQKHAEKIAREFKWDKYDPISVSFRDGKYWVIDGQHRLYAIKKNAGKDVVVICRVYYGLTEVEEAEMFLRKGITQKKLSINDMFKVLHKTGDETISGMVKGAERAGWIVDFKSGSHYKGKIKAVYALRICYEAVSFEQYVEALRILKEAWNGDSDSANAQILKGMTLFVKTYWGQYIRGGLVDNLSKVPIANFIRDGKAYTTSVSMSGGSGIGAGRPFAKAIHAIYNRGRRTKKLEDLL